MTTETKKEVRESYDVTIQRRARELCESLGITDVKQVALIHTTLKDTGLESWNNGRQAGFNRGVKVKQTETAEKKEAA